MQSGLLLFTRHTGSRRSVVSSLVKAPPNYEPLCTITRTMRGPWPHKSCPTPTIVRRSTMASPEPRVPPRNSSAQRRTPALIPSERARWQRWQEKNCRPLGGDDGRTQKPGRGVWARRQLRQRDASDVCAALTEECHLLHRSVGWTEDRAGYLKVQGEKLL